MERLVADSHESKQRCVAEIISGLIRGSKHWSFLKVQLQNKMILIIQVYRLSVFIKL